MLKMHHALRSHHFDVWIAARLRVAQLKLKPEISAKLLWSPRSSLFDSQLFAVLTWKQFMWLNRHGSFADAGSVANSVERGATGWDMHRKRRERTDFLSSCAWSSARHGAHISTLVWMRQRANTSMKASKGSGLRPRCTPGTSWTRSTTPSPNTACGSRSSSGSTWAKTTSTTRIRCVSVSFVRPACCTTTAPRTAPLLPSPLCSIRFVPLVLMDLSKSKNTWR
mmetsp:Transcript_6358/g.19789  ORF Transcript_6358/g.19789 Transcript_6358/m.19789 type:complete len:224 (-) Transcript_6358:1884-2555(-)